MLGGSAQSTSGVTSSIDFSPVIQFGEKQDAKIDKEASQTQTQTPRQDASTTASVGLGFGGDGSGGTVMKSQAEDTALPVSSTSDKDIFKTVGSNMGILAIGALALGGAYILGNGNKKKAA